MTATASGVGTELRRRGLDCSISETPSGRLSFAAKLGNGGEFCGILWTPEAYRDDATAAVAILEMLKPVTKRSQHTGG